MGPFRKEICEIVSEMLDNPNEIGIYPTSACYEKLDALIEQQEEFWMTCIKDDADRAGIDTRGIIGNAILHTMSDRLIELQKGPANQPEHI